jgi:hypothetical protein
MIAIEALDEWQGMTRELIEEWMRSDGCGWESNALTVQGRDTFAIVALNTLPGAVCVLAQSKHVSPQIMLRQINPRMRKGWPSNTSIVAHGLPDGNWLMRDDEGVLRSGYFFDHSGDVKSFAYDTEGGGEWMFSEAAAECSFWPCDDFGNKVRWPTDEHGAML